NRVRTRLILRPTYDMMNGGFLRPTEIDGFLAIDLDAQGRAHGTLSAAGQPASLIGVAGTLANGMLELDAGAVRVNGTGSLSWTRFQIRFEPPSGDTLYSGTGSMIGSWMNVAGDQIDQTGCRAPIAAVLDENGEDAHLAQPSLRSRMAILPFDRLEVTFGEPVRAMQALSDVRLRTGTAAVAADLAPPPDTPEGALPSLTFRPTAFYAFGARISIGVGNLLDLAGNAIPAPSDGLVVAGDPGTLLQNPGFEQSSAGWIANGRDV